MFFPLTNPEVLQVDIVHEDPEVGECRVQAPCGEGGGHGISSHFQTGVCRALQLTSEN